MPQTILEARSINKFYELNDNSLHILKDLSFSIGRGECVAVTGPSGSGKSTLLGLCAGLDSASDGQLILCDEDLTTLNEDQRAGLRSHKVGFIFQAFQLLPTLTALENVMVPMELQGKSGPQVENRAKELLRDVGLDKRHSHYPSQLSGGEQQRVAIARAFINQPDILFADEPTGNLDGTTGKLIEEQIFALNQKHNTTLVLVTHDEELAAKADRRLRLKEGSLVDGDI